MNEKLGVNEGIGDEEINTRVYREIGGGGDHYFLGRYVLYLSTYLLLAPSTSLSS